MHTETLSLYSASSGDAAASLDIANDGLIVAFYWSVDFNAVADNDQIAAEVSFASTNALTANDTKNVVASTRVWNNLVTSGMTAIGHNWGLSGIAIPAWAGERMYLHTAITGAGRVRWTGYEAITRAHALSRVRLRRA